MDQWPLPLHVRYSVGEDLPESIGTKVSWYASVSAEACHFVPFIFQGKNRRHQERPGRLSERSVAFGTRGQPAVALPLSASGVLPSLLVMSLLSAGGKGVKDSPPSLSWRAVPLQMALCGSSTVNGKNENVARPLQRGEGCLVRCGRSRCVPLSYGWIPLAVG